MNLFVYGSNLFSKRLIERVKSPKFISIGFVKKHKLAFHKKSNKDGSGKADCFYTGKAIDKVWGAVFELDGTDKELMDRYEGLGNGYNEKEVIVHCGNKNYPAKTYIADNRSIDPSLQPYDWYLEYIKKGAEEFCLPHEYVNKFITRAATMKDQNSERSQKHYQFLNETKNEEMDMGGFTITEWKGLRKRLSKNNDENDWKKAAGWFKERLDKRYFDPIKKIAPNVDGAGFTITSILCILIEHLAAFKLGMIHNYLKRGNDPRYEYRFSDKIYKDFLKSADVFKGYFHTDDSTPPPFCADDFYKNVRCALLHEACTKNNWIINVSCHSNNNGGVPFKRDNHFKIIYRDILLEKISSYVVTYITELTNIAELTNGEKLRMNFARKMDSLCEINPDPDNYAWWKDN